jgi:hypothetical protein
MSHKHRTRDHDPHAPPTTTVIDLSVAQARLKGGRFAEKVVRKKSAPTTHSFSVITNPLGGVKLFEDKRRNQMVIKFGEGRPNDRPSRAMIDLLEEAGYRRIFNESVWTHPIRPDTAITTRFVAGWLYEQIRRMIRQEKGITPWPELPR